MRFAAKRTFSRFAYKAELTLNRLFNMGSLHSLQSRDKRAGNRGEKNTLWVRGEKNTLWVRGEKNTLWVRGEKTPSGGGEINILWVRTRFEPAF